MRVLVAVDLKREPERIVDAAAAWGVRLGATVDVAFAGGFRELEGWAGHPQIGTLVTGELRRIAAEDRAALDALLERIPAENRGAVHLLQGDPSEAVPALAHRYDLVAVGTHGRQGLAHLILGSVADRIVRGAVKPVLVVRGPPPEGSFSALCAVDVREAGGTAHLVPWLEDLGAKADLVYVSPVAPSPSPEEMLFVPDWPVFEKARRDAEAAAITARLGELPAPLRGAAMAEIGPVSATLSRIAGSYPLAILETHGRTGFDRFWLGSVAEHVLRTAPCSVLVLRRAA